MAGRPYGGRFSPDGSAPAPGEPGQAKQPAPFRNRRARRVSIRARLMFILPLPLLLAGIGAIMRGSPREMLVELGAFAGLMLSAWLLNEGLRAEESYNARTIAGPPSIPRKAFAAVLTGASIAAAGVFNPDLGLFGAIAFGIVAGLAHVAGVGRDTMKKNGMECVVEFQNQRVARAIDQAGGLVREITGAAARIGDRRIEGRIERLCDQAREVFRIVEEDPSDFAHARTFLSVYLLGLRDSTIKFADIYGRSRDPEALREYEGLLGDLETSFTKHRTNLLENNRSDLDIEIEVLRERLQQDGLTARQPINQ
jgi:hypothetical protein